MNWSKMIWAAIVAFISLIITDLIIHLLLLQNMYRNLSNVGIFQSWDVMISYWWIILIVSAFYSFFFALIFAKGYEGRGVGEIIRFSIYVTLFTCFVFSFTQFVLYGVPYGLVWLWIILGFIQNLIMAIFVALIYRPKVAATPA